MRAYAGVRRSLAPCLDEWPAAVLRLVLVACVAAVATLGATGTALAVPQPPLVVDGHELDGQVSLSPATQVADGDRVTWVLANGGEGTLTFELAVHEIEATTAGVEVGEPAGVALGAEEVTLAPGELARIPLTLPPGTEPGALALVASTVEADPPTTLSGVVLVGGGGEVIPTVAGTDASGGVLTVRLDADGPALVDVALRATAWPGFVHTTEVVEGLYVPAGGRDLAVSLDGAVAGRLTVEVAVGGDPGARATETVWWWPREVVVVAIVVVLVLAGAGVLWRRAREE